MKITWFGHSCFLIENASGRKILIDPYDGSLSNCEYKGTTDVILISHDHADHNSKINVKNNTITLESPSTYQDQFVNIKGIPSFHDNMKGAKRGSNTIFIIETDGYRLCHLGDLGHKLSSESISLIDNTDVLFIPVDENFTLSPKNAAEICNSLNCRIIIPMHYKTDCINYPVRGIESFLTLMDNVVNISSNVLEIDTTIPDTKKVVLFKLD